MGVVKLINKVKKLKPVFFALTGTLIVILAATILISNYPIPLKLASLVSFKHSPSPIALSSPLVSPSPMVPSEKALKIAAFATVRLSEQNKKIFKEKYGNANMSDAELIRIWALKMDDDSALMAQNEAVMQKSLTQEGATSTYYSEPQYSQPVQSNPTNSNLNQFVQEQKQECLQKQTAYSTCLSEYNNKMLEYNNCIQDSFKNKYGYCSMPTNYCPKPYCSCIDPKKHPELYIPTA